MVDRVKYAEVRQQIIEMMKLDLMGPSNEREVLDENPRYSYIIGVLAPQAAHDGHCTDCTEQEVDTDYQYDKDDYAAETEDDEPVRSTRFMLPSSIGISFYLETATPEFCTEVSWGNYRKHNHNGFSGSGKDSKKTSYLRQPMKEILTIDLGDFNKNKEIPLSCDRNVSVYISKITLKSGYSLVSVHLINKHPGTDSNVESLMFQAKIKVFSPDAEQIFVAEHKCRDVLAADEFYFEKRPVFGRGRGCAAAWGKTTGDRTGYIESEFIPQYELPNVVPEISGLGFLEKNNRKPFSMYILSNLTKRAEILDRLNVLGDLYGKWIREKLILNDRMKSSDFREKVGNFTIEKCRTALNRIREGIDLLKRDDIAFDAFCFMNRVMLLQRNIMNYSRAYGSGKDCTFADYTDYGNPENDFGWRPFQIAFILMNLNAIVDPVHRDREIVDLLYFPTGGGKTEAYLGLMAFVIANRRLRAKKDDEFNRDGGVTAILRYTLRLLTTQQRDRITKMVIAAEMVRREEPLKKYGKAPISIGFWVGGGVTPNKFDDLESDPKQKKLIYNQLLTCPFCGKPLTEKEFEINSDTKSVSIYCADEKCIFYRGNGRKMPVFLVDEEIYAKCPTIILSTVDKFARLPWTPETDSLFGKVDRVCSRHGYVAVGEKHVISHNKKGVLPASTLKKIKAFLPPELIIQDELHLITGPLGTIYGAYETIIEDLCTYKSGSRTIRPKYIASTATIKNANEQARCLYGRKETAQFPAQGLEIGDSFFIREIPVEAEPFRKYVGICASGQSVKTALLRVYSIILQKSFELKEDEKCRSYVDPYYTLIGYYNSIRELGGAVRLLQDDIPDRIKRIMKRYGMHKQRFLNHTTEITSRIPSFKIPEKLKQLETTSEARDCLDVALATNMIAVGMDVDRLGLMVVTGQPKQNSEYIQATSRIGRAFPGLVVTLYNPYRPRDLSHYENFTGYHAQLYRFVEGTTSTPFSARARDRVLHALIISAIRLKYPYMAPNEAAQKIGALKNEHLVELKNIIFNRLNIVNPEARSDVESEIDAFIGSWEQIANSDEKLFYYVPYRSQGNRLMNFYDKPCENTEKPTLNSMREVESAANMYYYTEDENGWE